MLFKDATQCFVHTSHMDLRSILGEEFYTYAEDAFNCTNSGRTTRNKLVVQFILCLWSQLIDMCFSNCRYPGVLQSGCMQHILTDRN